VGPGPRLMKRVNLVGPGPRLMKRVNLVGPGPRLMKKEFTVLRSHKGWETLLYIESRVISISCSMSAEDFFHCGKGGTIKFITNLHPLPRLIMNGAMPLLSIYVFLVRTEKTSPFLLFFLNLSSNLCLGLPSGLLLHIFPHVCIIFLSFVYQLYLIILIKCGQE